MAITTTPSGGSQGEFSTYTPIYSTTLSSGSASITFSNIPTTYTDLVLVMNGAASAASDIGIQFNGDSGTNYSRTTIDGNGTSPFSNRNSAVNHYRPSNYGNFNTTYGFNMIVNFFNYSNGTTYKTMMSRANNAGTGVTATVGLWRNSSPITSIYLYSTDSQTFNTGSTITLYGIRDASNAANQYGLSATGVVYTPTTLGSSFKVGDQVYIPYTGAQQTISIPAGVGVCQFEVIGASGGYAYQSSAGGKGGYAKGLYNFNGAATTTYAYVGGQGASRLASTGSGTLAGGFNGGGNGFWASNTTNQGYASSGGGGGTDIRIGGTALANRVIVAGGGGGEGGGTGGDGGYTSGTVGYPLTAGDPFSAQGGFGGTQAAGGAGGGRAGTGTSTNGNAGSLGVGGDGGSDRIYGQGGGGGGGYYGGGGGGTCSNGTGGAGGGGSSYIGGVTSGTTTTGANLGNGYAIITRLS